MAARIPWIAGVLLFGAAGAYFAFVAVSGKRPEPTDVAASVDLVRDGESGADSRSPLQDWRAELLDLAHRAASSPPVEPHIKNRSRFQAHVIETALEVDDPERALRYAEDVVNWRQGVALADAALYRARHGASRSQIQPLLDRAASIADEAAKDRTAQAWRIDRIRAAIAAGLLWFGAESDAGPFMEGLTASEFTKIDTTLAKLVKKDGVQARVENIVHASKGASLDRVKGLLAALVELDRRFGSDPEILAKLDEAARIVWTQTPRTVRVDHLLEGAQAALDRDDRERALALVAEADEIVGSTPWAPEDAVPLHARLARVRYLAGDEDAALKELRESVDLFEKSQKVIVDIFRTEALLPVALAYHAIGDREQATKLLDRTVTEATRNPNSRPRAEDLSEVCCALVREGIQPDAAVRDRLSKAVEELSAPW